MWLFLRLYLLIVVTMLVVGWSVEQTWRHFGDSPVEDSALKDFTRMLLRSLEDGDPINLPNRLQELSSNNRLLQLISEEDLAGNFSITDLDNNKVISMQEDSRTWWLFAKLKSSPTTSQQILSIRYQYDNPQRTSFEWFLLLLFYAAIGMAVMLWVWPLSRDIQTLKQSTLGFGRRNWHFNPALSRRSQVYDLSQAFHAMANRINHLVQSHKDMSNAVSHEIKTPLARMKFSIELLQENLKDNDDSRLEIQRYLDDIDDDIDKLNALITATMRYAILDSADFKLNIEAHDFKNYLPALVENNASPKNIRLSVDIQEDIDLVHCDGHLIATLVSNLLGNACRYASSEVRVSFLTKDGLCFLRVDDDGPGITAENKKRVFNSFVRLDGESKGKNNFGLGLAIVKKIAEWHLGGVGIVDSSLGGVCFEIHWPHNLPEQTESADPD